METPVRPPRFETLLQMMEAIRQVNDNMGELKRQLGVVREQPVETPTTCPNGEMTKEVNLVRVLDDLPIWMEEEIHRVHISIDEIRQDLL